MASMFQATANRVKKTLETAAALKDNINLKIEREQKDHQAVVTPPSTTAAAVDASHSFISSPPVVSSTPGKNLVSEQTAVPLSADAPVASVPKPKKAAPAPAAASRPKDETKAQIVPLTDKQKQRAEALKVVNKMFPGTEEPPSLEKLEHALARYSGRGHKLDEQLLAAVKTGSRGQFNIKHAKDAIHEVSNRMQAFKQKAADLDTFMEDFSKETRPLERTKVNLTRSLTALKNLRMLVSAVQQLQQLALDGEYAQSAPLLSGARGIWSTFDAHNKHPKLLSLGGSLRDIEEMLKRQVMADFQNPGKLTDERTKDACSVIDALGDDAIEEFLEWYCSNFLRSYPGVWQRYQKDGEQWLLGRSDMARVVDWFQNLMLERQQFLAVTFPRSWSVSQRATDQFGLKVGKELEKLLEQEEKKGTLVKERLVEMQKLAHDFEVEMSQKYSADYVGRISGLLIPYTKVSFIKGPASRTSSNNTPTDSGGGDNIAPVMTLSLDDLLEESDPESDDDSKTPKASTDKSKKTDQDPNLAKVYLPISNDDDFPGCPKIDPLPFSLPNDQIEIAAFEMLVLSTELGAESTGFVANDDAMSCLDTIRAALRITRRMFKTLQSNLMPGREETAPLIPEAGPETTMHRLEMLCYMRPRNFLTGDNLEDFATWRRRQMEIVLCCVRLGLHGHASRRWEVKIEGREYSTAELLTSIEQLAEEILELSANTLDVWEKHVEGPYTQTIGRFAAHILPPMQKLCTSYPKPLAHRLYECLVSTLFDVEEGGQPISMVDSCVALLAYPRSALGLTSRIHALAFSRCLFAQYLEFHNLNVCDILTVHIRQALVSNISTSTSNSSSSAATLDHDRLYEVVVISEIERDCREMLSDFRSNFAFEPLSDIPPLIDLYLCTRKARLLLFPKEREKRGGVDGEWAVLDRLIEKSVQRSYLRLRESFTEGSKGPLLSLQAANLTGALPDEISLDRDQFCPAFKAHLSRPLVVCVRTIAALCKEDIIPCLRSVQTMDSAILQLWQNVVDLQSHIESVYPGDPNVLEIAAEFEPLVGVWLQQQQERFDDCLERSLAFEETNCWAPISNSWKDGPGQALSGSAIDIFTMFTATVPSIFDLGVPISPDQVRTLAESVDLIVMKYANKVVNSCGSRDSLIPQTTSSSSELAEAVKQFFSKEAARRASLFVGKTGKKFLSEMRGFGAHVGSEIMTLIDNDSKDLDIDKHLQSLKLSDKIAPDLKDIVVPLALQQKDPKVTLQTLDVLCVRLNNLRFADKQLKLLEKEFVQRLEVMMAKFGKNEAELEEKRREMKPVVDQLFVQAQMSLNQGEKLVMEYIGTKVVWFDLRDSLLIQLYTPVPCLFPLSKLLQQNSPLDDVLIQLSDLLGSEFFKSVFAIIFKNIVAVIETVLFAEKNMVSRTFTPDDAMIFREDVDTLKEYFIQRDEDGTAQGLSAEDVGEWTRRLTSLIDLLFSKSSSELIKLVEDPRTPETHAHKPVTRLNITRVLLKRSDKDARKFFSRI